MLNNSVNITFTYVLLFVNDFSQIGLHFTNVKFFVYHPLYNAQQKNSFMSFQKQPYDQTIWCVYYTYIYIFVFSGKYTFPKGTDVILLPFLSHKNPKVFPEPEKFDPRRFFEANSDKEISTHSFAEGKRSCIGMYQRVQLMKCLGMKCLGGFFFVI